MQLVERHIINVNHQLFSEIDELAFRSKNLYDLANYHMRQEFIGSGAVFSLGQLDRVLQSTDACNLCGKTVLRLFIVI
jgi:putative transposase